MNRNEHEIALILVGETNVQGRDTPATAFRHALPLLKSADVLFGHLEAPLTPPSQDPTCPDIPHKQGWRHSGPDAVKAFSDAGFDAVSLASKDNLVAPLAADLGPGQAIVDQIQDLSAPYGTRVTVRTQEAIVHMEGQ